MANLIGQKFNRLTVVKRLGSNKHNEIVWLCKCECGNETKATTNSLRRNNTRSCGCLQKEKASKTFINLNKTHGLSRDKNGKKTRLFRIWSGMRTRCLNQNNHAYPLYGGRGICICKEWITDFKAFHNWSVNNGYQDSLTIDRIDSNKGYSPDNCRWASRKTQSNNKRDNLMIEFNGKTLNLKQWSEELNMNYIALTARIRRGWSIEKTFTTPLKSQNKVEAI